MAKFIVNSTNDKAIRKEQIEIVAIKAVVIGGVTSYELWVRSETERQLVFETDATLEGITAKAAIVLAALEE